MGIGTSIGLHFKDEMEMWQHAFNNKTDKQMEMTPDDLIGNNAIAKDPANITNDSGDIVDYDITGDSNGLIKPLKP